MKRKFSKPEDQLFREDLERRKAHQARFNKGDVIPDKVRSEEYKASAKRAQLRKEMGEELYKQYFPDEVAEEVRSKEWIENYKKPEWLTNRQKKNKNKKVDYSDWNI